METVWYNNIQSNKVWAHLVWVKYKINITQSSSLVQLLTYGKITFCVEKKSLSHQILLKDWRVFVGKRIKCVRETLINFILSFVRGCIWTNSQTQNSLWYNLPSCQCNMTSDVVSIYVALVWYIIRETTRTAYPLLFLLC